MTKRRLIEAVIKEMDEVSDELITKLEKIYDEGYKNGVRTGQKIVFVDSINLKTN